MGIISWVSRVTEFNADNNLQIVAFVEKESTENLILCIILFYRFKGSLNSLLVTICLTENFDTWRRDRKVEMIVCIIWTPILRFQRPLDSFFDVTLAYRNADLIFICSRYTELKLQSDFWIWSSDVTRKGLKPNM